MPGPGTGIAGAAVAAVKARYETPVVRRLAHEPLAWRPTTLLVTVRRHRCGGIRIAHARRLVAGTRAGGRGHRASDSGDSDLAWFEAYAAAGGHLVLGPRTAYADHEARARAEEAPAMLTKAAGVRFRRAFAVERATRIELALSAWEAERIDH